MDIHSSDNHAEKPRKRRNQQANGRWRSPASPLQAARFAVKKLAKDVVLAIQSICEGHNGNPCRIDASKLSEYETGRRRPSIEHMTALCRYYQRSPEELGFIRWRDEPADPPSAVLDSEAGAASAQPGSESPSEADARSDKEQLVMDWLMTSGATLAAAVLAALYDYPIKPSAQRGPGRGA